LYYNCQNNFPRVTKTICIIIARTTSQEWKTELYYNCQKNVTRVIKKNCIIIVRTMSHVVLAIIIQCVLSLFWRCSDNYNTIRLCHPCDVVLTIIIQFIFITLVTLFWQLWYNSFLSLLWRCSDNYNTIRVYHSCDVVLTIIMQFVFVTLVTLFWQL
jgi:hypothetical protein